MKLPSANIKMATKEDGEQLCSIIFVNVHGVYPALTGGLLYKGGSRKDIDIVIYRHRQDCDKFEMTDLEHDFNKIGVTFDQCFGFVTKARWNGFVVDLFNPETEITEIEHIYKD